MPISYPVDLVQFALMLPHGVVYQPWASLPSVLILTSLLLCSMLQGADMKATSPQGPPPADFQLASANGKY